MIDSPPPATILDRIHDVLTRYVAFSDPAQSTVLSLFVLHTHAFPYARTTPYIYITSAEKQSGKTRTLEVVQQMCRNAERLDNLTSAAMFRAIEHLSPTLMVDEVDTIFSGSKNEELRGVLNSGYKSGGYILRAIGNPLGEDGGLVKFGTFCPKILAGIDNGQVPDTVLDRCIRITLRRKAPGQTVEEFYAEDIEDEMAELHSSIRAWVGANSDLLADRAKRPERLDKVSDRANEISRPLLALANLNRGWAQRAKHALTSLLGEDEIKLSPQAKCLLAIRNWFDANPDATFMPSKVISALTNENGHQVGHWLSAYGIKPGTYRGQVDGVGEKRNMKGYARAQFEDPFNRYLPMRDQ